MSRKACKIEVLTIDCYDNDNKSLGIGYLNNIPIIFRPLPSFNSTTQPACRNGRTCFTDSFCIVNSSSTPCYDGLIFFINDHLWRVKNRRWMVDEGGLNNGIKEIS